MDEVTAYCRERRSPVDPVAFWNFYASLDPKAAAFERLRSEAEERKRRAPALARAQDDPDTRKKRINRARMAIIRHMPEGLETFRRIIKNGKNRKESIWQLMKGKASK